MHFVPCTRPLWEWHYFPETVERWHREGLPQNVYLPADASDDVYSWDLRQHGGVPLSRYFNLDRGQPYCPGEMSYVPVNTGMLPAFPDRIMAEDERTVTRIDSDGVMQQSLKGISPAMPKFLEFPVKARKDFESISRRYDAALTARYPPNWAEYKASIRGRDYPLGLVFDGFFGRIRKWLGLEGLCYMLADDPALIYAMCDFHADFVVQTIRRAVTEVDIDYVNIWEDMAYKNGSLVSPADVRKYMLPGYRRITDLLRSHGIKIIFVDSDGRIDELIPIWLEAGINGVWPIEVAAGMDPVALRRQYGQDLLLVGGIDKRELSKGKEDVEEEVMRRVPGLIEQGGYIPTIDHSVSPDIPFDNYVHFRKLLSGLSQGG
jgi:uroporphyrinogen decarboxylase